MGRQVGALGLPLPICFPLPAEEEKLKREGWGSWRLHRRRLQARKGEQGGPPVFTDWFFLALIWAQGYFVTQRCAPGQRNCQRFRDQVARELLRVANSASA